MKRNREWTVTHRVMEVLRRNERGLTLDDLTRRIDAPRNSVYMALYHLAQHRCVTKRYHQWSGVASYTPRPEHLDTRTRTVPERKRKFEHSQRTVLRVVGGRG